MRIVLYLLLAVVILAIGIAAVAIYGWSGWWLVPALWLASVPLALSVLVGDPDGGDDSVGVEYPAEARVGSSADLKDAEDRAA